jgi:hypothetical protein
MQSFLMIAVALPVDLFVPRGRRSRLFLPLSCAATLAIYGVAGWFAVKEFHQLRERFPYVSMEERLPPAKLAPTAETLTPAAEKWLASLEDHLEHGEPLSWRGKARLEFLERLHEDAVGVFVNRPGFGASRMSAMFDYLLDAEPRDPTPPQPGKQPLSQWSASALQGAYSQREDADVFAGLTSVHRDSLLDFANPKDFGLFKDRRRVLGYRPHRFSKVPVASTTEVRWTVQTLDLVGLVLHDLPAVYVSDHLPRMDELRGAPTRPPDDFETEGLKILRGGKNLFVRETKHGGRMLGAIRAARQCLGCHSGQRGQLLGAFSYTLTLGD